MTVDVALSIGPQPYFRRTVVIHPRRSGAAVVLDVADEKVRLVNVKIADQIAIEHGEYVMRADEDGALRVMSLWKAICAVRQLCVDTIAADTPAEG